MIEIVELHAYVDGELSKADADRVRLAVMADPRLAAEVQAIETMRAAVARHARACECEEAWKGCVGRLNELDRSRRVEGFFGRYALALSGDVFMAIVAGGLMNRGATPVQTQDLARAVAGFLPSGSTATATPAQRKWVDALLKQADVSLDPSRLYSGPSAWGEFDGHPVVRVPLKDATGEMALLVFDRNTSFGGLVPLDSEGRYSAGKIAQLNCVVWSGQQGSFVLVGDRSAQDLGEVAARIAVKR
ncbi:hypothetical protein EON81_01120 [bacterium]|nr:MAG: hypothetical protein EON81_01120 [bacterium]